VRAERPGSCARQARGTGRHSLNGAPLHRLAADALVASLCEIERLSARVELIQGVARLNVETIRNMQRAAVEAASGAAFHGERGDDLDSTVAK